MTIIRLTMSRSRHRWGITATILHDLRFIIIRAHFRYPDDLPLSDIYVHTSASLLAFLRMTASMAGALVAFIVAACTSGSNVSQRAHVFYARQVRRDTDPGWNTLPATRGGLWDLTITRDPITAAHFRVSSGYQGSYNCIRRRQRRAQPTAIAYLYKCVATVTHPVVIRDRIRAASRDITSISPARNSTQPLIRLAAKEPRLLAM